MSKNNVLIFAILSLISGQVSPKPQSDSVILSSKNVPPSLQGNGDQIYQYSFATSNQIKQEQKGFFDEKGENTVVQGLYSYVDPSGKLQKVTYIADTNGYRVLPSDSGHSAAISLNIEEGPMPVFKTTGISSALLTSLSGGSFG